MRFFPVFVAITAVLAVVAFPEPEAEQPQPTIWMPPDKVGPSLRADYLDNGRIADLADAIAAVQATNSCSEAAGEVALDGLLRHIGQMRHACALRDITPAAFDVTGQWSEADKEAFIEEQRIAVGRVKQELDESLPEAPGDRLDAELMAFILHTAADTQDTLLYGYGRLAEMPVGDSGVAFGYANILTWRMDLEILRDLAREFAWSSGVCNLPPDWPSFATIFDELNQTVDLGQKLGGRFSSRADLVEDRQRVALEWAHAHDDRLVAGLAQAFIHVDALAMLWQFYGEFPDLDAFGALFEQARQRGGSILYDYFLYSYTQPMSSSAKFEARPDLQARAAALVTLDSPVLRLQCA